tara:strand:+ start:494 stop:754 length:261 start_codon:yes stop_codon:yes gene_type:complete
MKTQDEIIGAIENIIMTNQICANIDDFDMVDSYNEVAIAFNQYLDGDLEPTRSYVNGELSALITSVKGARAVERVSQAMHEIGGQY